MKLKFTNSKLFLILFLTIALIYILYQLYLNINKKSKPKNENYDMKDQVTKMSIKTGRLTPDEFIQKRYDTEPAPWFLDLYNNKESNINKYYDIKNYFKIYLKPEYGGEYLGKVPFRTESGKIIKPDGAKVDLREIIALLGPPAQATANWMTDFINMNEGASKIKDRLKVVDRKLYITPLDYFVLVNKQTGRCVHPDGGSDNPEESTILVFHDGNCNDNPIPDKLLLSQDKNGILRLKNGACVAAYSDGNANGKELNYTYKYCNQPFEFLPNGALRHKGSGRCVYPRNGYAKNDTELVTWNDCNAGERINFIRKYLPKENDQYLGYVDDKHIGQIKTTDGKWLQIGDLFKLIAGPSEKERFRYMNNSEFAEYFQYHLDVYQNLNEIDKSKYIYDNKEFFRYVCLPWESFDWLDDAVNFAKDTIKDVGNFAKDVGNKIKDGTMTAADWVEARALDAANFSENAAKDVGSWAKDISGDALDWAKTAGNLVVKNLVDIGNKVGNFARDAANKIKDTAINTSNIIKQNVYDKGLKVAGNAIADTSVAAAMAVKKAAEQAIDFLKSFPEIAKKAVDNMINWLKGAGSTVWSQLQKPVGMIINIIFEGTICEYKAAAKLSDQTRDLSLKVKALEPALLPRLTEAFKQISITLINMATNYVLSPILVLVMPFISQYLDPQIDKLMKMLIYTNELKIGITQVADNTLFQLSKVVDCSYLDPPDLSGLEIKVPEGITFSADTEKELNDLFGGIPDSPETFRYLTQFNTNSELENFRYYSMAPMTPAKKAAILVEKMQTAIILYQYIMENKDKIKDTIKMFTNWDQLKQKICEWTSQNKLLTGFIAILQKAQEKVIKSSDQRIIKNREKILSIIRKVLVGLSKLLVAVAVAKTLQPILSLVPSGSASNQIKDIVNKFTNIDSTLLEIIPEFGKVCKI
jgi:hypothetical protein